MRKLGLLIIMFLLLVSCGHNDNIIILSGHIVKAISENNILISGTEYFNNKHTSTAFLTKISKNGDIFWTKSFYKSYVMNYFLEKRYISIFLQCFDHLKYIKMDYNGNIIYEKKFYVIVPTSDCIIKEENCYTVAGIKFILKIDFNGRLISKLNNPIKKLWRFIAKVDNKYILFAYDDRFATDDYDFVNIYKNLKLYSINKDLDILISDNDEQSSKIRLLNYAYGNRLIIGDNNEIIYFDNSLNANHVRKTDNNFQKLLLDKDLEIFIKSNDVLGFGNFVRAYRAESLIWEIFLQGEKVVILDGAILDDNIVFVGYKAIKKIDTVHLYGHSSNLYVACYNKSGKLLWKKEVTPQKLIKY
ncbi:hypothetical protein WKV44_10510 [Spirochaetia bacterium 38H-sp]|uniref:Lipoprotein n=1 Tax=Rarispira pelagica TaxID=3141764 RepID=A0ABU9UE67_9SPIR